MSPTTPQHIRTSIIGCMLIALIGCGAAEPETSTDTPQVAQTPPIQETQLAKAESFIDAFYSFDAEQLAPLLAEAPDSAASLLYYQGWAEGGNYKIVNRGACAPTEVANTVACPITVQDDPVLALKTGFNVTDTFTMTFTGTALTAVDTSSNDQPIYYQARDWVLAEMPDIMTGPCKGFFAGGPTPADCARAMTAGYQKFAESDAFPGTSTPNPE